MNLVPCNKPDSKQFDNNITPEKLKKLLLSSEKIKGKNDSFDSGLILYLLFLLNIKKIDDLNKQFKQIINQHETKK